MRGGQGIWVFSCWCEGGEGGESGGSEGEDLADLMAQMDQELASTEVGKSFEKVKVASIGHVDACGTCLLMCLSLM